MARPAYSEDKIDAIQREICTAALAVFRRDGLSGLSLRRIAAELGWTAAALYRYFANKNELLDAIRTEGFIRMGSALRLAKQRASSAGEAARLGMRAYLEFASQEPELFRLMYALHQNELETGAQLKHERERAFAAAEEIASENPEVTDPKLTAHLLWVGAHGLAALAMAGQLDLGCSYEDLIEPLIDRFTGPVRTGESG